MKVYTNRKYGAIPVGLWVRRQIAKTWIYRVRRGHGYYGTTVGEQIQDRFAYFVPNSINNPEGERSRGRFTAAVNGWQALSNEDKAWWNAEAKRKRLAMSGYNLFIREFEEVEVVSGIIAMWKGTIATIPAGWFLCDGNNGTPDLRDKFIVGAKQDDGGVAKTNVKGSLQQTGGDLGHTHQIQSAGHTHSFTGSGHDHFMSQYKYTDDTGEHYVWDAYQYSDYGYATGETDYGYATGATDTTNEVPPYYALAFIMKA